MKIGRQIVVSIVAHFLALLLSFVSIKILTNTLSVSTYGIYSLLFATIGILAICLELGFHSYLITKVPGEEKTKGFSYFTSNFILKLIVLIIFTTLAIGIGLPLVRHYNFNVSSRIIILSCFILMFGLLFAETLRFHSLRKRLEFTAIMNLFSEKLWILPLFFFWWFIRKTTLDQILLIRLFPIILLLFVSLWVMKRKGEKIGNNKLFDKQIIRKGFIFGAPLTILGFGHYLLMSADRYIIAFLLSTTAVGHYFLAYTLIYLGYSLTSSIFGVSFYHFAEAYNLSKNNNFQLSRAKDIFNCSLRFSLIVGFFLCAIFALLRFPLIQFLATKEYLIATKTMLFLSPFPVLLILSRLFHQVLILEKQRKILVKGYIFAPLLNIILNFILIPEFGINGAALATVVSYLFIFLFFLLKIRKYHVLEFSILQFLKLAICLLISILPIYVLAPQSATELLYSGITSVIIYFLSLIILKVVTKEDWEILWGHERKST